MSFFTAYPRRGSTSSSRNPNLMRACNRWSQLARLTAITLLISASSARALAIMKRLTVEYRYQQFQVNVSRFKLFFSFLQRNRKRKNNHRFRLLRVELALSLQTCPLFFRAVVTARGFKQRYRYTTCTVFCATRTKITATKHSGRAYTIHYV